MGVARVFRVACIYPVLLLSLACSSVLAFSIKPEPTDQEGNIISRTSSRWHILLEWNARMYEAFTQPVHELYLHRVFECQHDSSL
ncbi:MAG TPA: hypothetical protein VHO84_05650, partial [Syntrophorhabdaceae bacterium]|nr:hypothetical protein [Syntrophorhabdaceae bacterium]